ncbi:MAG: hypothetical protein HOC20_07715, partial [Chloroflexi bacterium]|nr:hypothetical protein [Chloroflexota bacterium]
RYCDKNWKASIRLLDEGRLEACLAFLGEMDAQATLRSARKNPNHNIALESFLRTIDPWRGRRSPLHNGSQIEARLGFGLRGIRIRKPPNRMSLYIRNPNRRGYLWGEVHSLVDWFSISPVKFGCAPGKTTRLIMKVDADRWPCRKRSWSLGMGLYEIILFDPEQRSIRRIRKTTAPGYWTLISANIALFILMMTVMLTMVMLIGD